MNTNCQPPNCPCFCPTADLPVAPIIVQQGGPATVVQVPIYGTQPFSAAIKSNPLLPITQVPVISTVRIFNGNILTIETAIPALNEAIGPYTAVVEVCNACGKIELQLQIEVAADITPVVTDCDLARQLWLPAGRQPQVGDQLLAFAGVNCVTLDPPDVCATLQATPPAIPAPISVLFGSDAGVCVQFTVADVLALYDTCAAINAFPVAAPLTPNDRLVVVQGGVCALTTLADVTASVVAFPLLAPDGSCVAPSYSFTSSSDSGMFYDPAGVGSVIIGDDNCTDFIAVGASIRMATAGVTRLTLSSAGAISGVAAAGQTIIFQTAGGTSGFQNTTAGASIFIGSVGNVSIFSGPGQTAQMIAPNAQIQAFAGGQISLANTGATPAALLVTSTGKIRFGTGTPTVHRFEFTEFGEIRVGVPPGDTPGVAGDVLTSAGAGLPAVWASASPAFPMLAPDGSCAAPSYSFSSSSDSGVWFDPAIGPFGAVVISDHNCANRINVGASVTAISSTGDKLVLGNGVLLSTPAGSGAIAQINISGGNTTSLVDSGGYINLTSGTAPGGGPALSYWYGAQPGGFGGGSVHGGGFGTFKGGSVELFAGGGPSNALGGTVRAEGSAAGGGDVVIALGANNFRTLIGDFVVKARDPSSDFGGYFLIKGQGGEWQLAGNPGIAGQRLTSQGPGLPPIWAP